MSTDGDADAQENERKVSLPAPVESLISHILTPGSTLNAPFLLVLDGAFAILLVVFLSLLAATWSLHFVALTFIELGLWASVKWCAIFLSFDVEYSDVKTAGMWKSCGGITKEYKRVTKKRVQKTKMIKMECAYTVVEFHTVRG